MSSGQDFRRADQRSCAMCAIDDVDTPDCRPRGLARIDTNTIIAAHDATAGVGICRTRKRDLECEGCGGKGENPGSMFDTVKSDRGKKAAFQGQQAGIKWPGQSIRSLDMTEVPVTI